MSEKEKIFDKLAKALNEKDTVTCLSLMTQMVGVYQKEKDEEKSPKHEEEINVKQNDNKKQNSGYVVKTTVEGNSRASDRVMGVILEVFAEQLTRNGFEGTVTVEVKAHE